MKCPYCNAGLREGKIHGINGKAAYWMPGEEIPFHFVTKKNVEKNGGIVLGDVTIGFIAAGNANGYVCDACKKMIIDLDIE